MKKNQNPTSQFIKPAREGLLVRYPAPIRNRFLPAEGAEVPWTQYWMRRVADGDCVVTKPPKKGGK